MSLENKVESIEALNASLRKSISEQSTKYIQDNYDMSKTSENVNNYANSTPFTSDDIYIKPSNNIEHSPLPLPNYLAKKETTNDHARTETVCQSHEVPAEYLRHNKTLSLIRTDKTAYPRNVCLILKTNQVKCTTSAMANHVVHK